MHRLDLRPRRVLEVLLILVPTVALAQSNTAGLSACAQEVTLFRNGNAGGVQSGPTQPTRLQLTEPVRLTYFMAYHWNDGRGQPPGTLGLQHDDGTRSGPWQAASAPGQSGVPNADWSAGPRRA